MISKKQIEEFRKKECYCHEIAEATGLASGTVNQILNKAKKENLVKTPERGVYMIVEEQESAQE